MTRQLYKVLSADLCSYNGGDLTWTPPSEAGPGEWHTVEGELNMCLNGLHLTDWDGLARWYKDGLRIFEVETDGELLEGHEKWCARSVRLVREVEPPITFADLKLALKQFSSYFKPSERGGVRKNWRAYVADSVLDAIEYAVYNAWRTAKSDVEKTRECLEQINTLLWDHNEHRYFKHLHAFTKLDRDFDSATLRRYGDGVERAFAIYAAVHVLIPRAIGAVPKRFSDMCAELTAILEAGYAPICAYDDIFYVVPISERGVSQ